MKKRGINIAFWMHNYVISDEGFNPSSFSVPDKYTVMNILKYSRPSKNSTDIDTELACSGSFSGDGVQTSGKDTVDVTPWIPVSDDLRGLHRCHLSWDLAVFYDVGWVLWVNRECEDTVRGKFEQDTAE
jgi:hypothetical protein